jgi:hypothetical protein
MSDWDQIKQDVEDNDNVLTVNMERLRDAYGVGRLGVNVVSKISGELAGLGLGHIPETLPTYQHEQVRLYKKGTRVGDTIDMILSPGQKKDQTIAERFSEDGPDYAHIVEQVRELVAE